MEEAEALHYDDDSVPSDFFDDFSNQDFMAGLDVVDVWDDIEQEQNPAANQIENGAQPIDQKPNREAKKRSHRRKYGRTRDRRSRSHSAGAKKKSKRDHDDALKRDPEKTKRDIQKDKDKWNKNNEEKLLSERLRVVETGLVPPGTEMEVDITEIKSNLKVVDLREKLRKKSRSPSFDLSTRLTRRNRSPARRSPARRRSPTPSRIRIRYQSPERRRSRSNPPRRRPSSPQPSSYERREHYRGGSPRPRRRSPVYSPSGMEREVWLRNRSRYHNRRSTSPSRMNDRRRNTPKDFLEELADKLKFDEKKKNMFREIRHKLNEPSQANPHQMFMPATGPKMGMHMPPGPVPMLVGMGPGPAMVPQPGIPGPRPFGQPLQPQNNNFFHPEPMMDPAPQYDQSFFIGQSETQTPFKTNNAAGFPHIVNIIPQPIGPPTNLNPVSTDIQKEEDKKAASKLLEEKTISLSDYLSVSAKYNADSSAPSNIHKKVKVLALCQDALKSLGNTSKLNGRFFYTKSSKDVEKPTTLKCLSPLRKIPVTRFNFTTPWRGGEGKGTTPSPLHKLMSSLGLPFKTCEEELVHSPRGNSSDSDIVYVPSESQQRQEMLQTYQAPVKHLTQPLTQPVVHTLTKPHIATVRFQTRQTQTDTNKCETCERRKLIKYKQEGSQCNNVSSVEVGTQITEDDVYKFGLRQSAVGATKKSLAHLTPAQLLGKEDPPVRRETYVSNRSAPNVSPERQASDFSSRRVGPPQGMSTSLADQLNMNTFESHPSGRHGFQDISDVTPNKFNNAERNQRMSIFNHAAFSQQRFVPDDSIQMHRRLLAEEEMLLEQHMLEEDNRRYQHLEEQFRMQPQHQHQPYFEPPEGRDYFMPQQSFGARKFF